MEENNIAKGGFEEPEFDLDNSMPTIIKVIGVGGGGGNAVSHMYKQNIKGVSFVVCNTDKQALKSSPVPQRLVLGINTTKGLGAGNKPEVARRAAEESKEEIAKLFDDDTQMAFITAGMGGGTGTGAAPVVARIAKEKGILTVGIVTIPFIFEGEKKILKALNGADEMRKNVDALMVINNERLADIYGELGFLDAFGKADDILTIAAQSISELITTEGRINLDFNDVNTTLRNGGVAIVSSGYGEGEYRMTKAIKDALNSPLLKNRDVYDSKHILVNIYFSQNASKENMFKMEEIREMDEFMKEFAPGVDVIWGAAMDNTLGDKLKVTILASGFDVSFGKEGDITSKPTVADTKIPAGDKTDKDKLKEAYGQSKVAEIEQTGRRRYYKILTADDFDDDDVIRELEKSPTFTRSNKIMVKKAAAEGKAESQDGAEQGPKQSENVQIVF